MAAVTIRPLREEDAAYFADEERKQGWHTEEGKFLDRLRDVRAGICISLVAELDGVPAGYVNVYCRHGSLAPSSLYMLSGRQDLFPVAASGCLRCLCRP